MTPPRFLPARMFHTTLAGALLAMSLVGCVRLKPAHDATRFYVLTATPPASGATTAPGEPGIILGRVEVADYLRSPQLAFRAAPNRIEYSDLHQWAEPLDAALPRVLEEDFLLRLGPRSPSPNGTAAREVRLSVLRFDLTRDGTARTEVICRVIDVPSRQVLVEQRLTRSTTTALSDTALDAAVATLSEQLGELADEAIELAQAQAHTSSS